MTRITALIFLIIVPFVGSNATTNNETGGTTPSTTPTCDLVAKAAAGETAAVRKMIDANCALDVKDASERTALNAAVMARHTNVSWLLILSGADVNIQFLRPPLHHAAENGETEIARQLINAGATIEAKPTNASYGTGTALHLAAKRGHVDTIQMLIDKKAVIDATDSSSQTPLHYAARHGEVESVRALLKAGAKINATNTDGKTPLHLTIQRVVHSPVLTSSSPSSDSSANDQIKKQERLIATARVLVESGANLDIKDSISITRDDVVTRITRAPLHYAALYDRTEIIRMLAAAGALLNLRDGNGNTPLHLASQADKVDAIRVLLQVGADDRAKNTARKRADEVTTDNAIKNMIKNPSIYWPIKAYAVGNRSSGNVDTTMRILCDDGKKCRVYFNCLDKGGSQFQGWIGNLEKARNKTTLGSIAKKSTLSLSPSELKTLVDAADDTGALDCALYSHQRVTVQVWSIADSGNANTTAYRMSEKVKDKDNARERASVRFYYGDTSTPYVHFRCLSDNGKCRKTTFKCVDDNAVSRLTFNAGRIDPMHVYTLAGSESSNAGTNTNTNTGTNTNAGTSTSTNTSTNTSSTDTGANRRIPRAAKGWYSCEIRSSKPFMVYVIDSVRKGGSLFTANSTTFSME